MHIVVTGATGNVGTSVLEALAREPKVRSITAIARRIPEMKAHKTHFVSADVADDQLAPIFEGADAVIHLAWQFQPLRRADELWSTNVLGSRRVFDAVRQAGVPKIVWGSSFAAYGAREGSELVGERFPTTGISSSTYSRHAVEVERRLDEFELKNPAINVVRLRPCLTLKRSAASQILRRFAGPLLPRAAFGQVAAQIGRQLASSHVQIVHARDVAEAYRQTLLNDVRGAFNVAPLANVLSSDRLSTAATRSTPSRAVLRAATLAFKLGLHRTDPSWMDLAMRSPSLDDTRARHEIGYSPRYTREEVVTELLAGLRDGAGLATPPLRPTGRLTAQVSNSAHVSVQYPTS
jgi:nucleoside-diphosphate-sugar epimerase